jgi:hypothetical protein
MSRGLGKVEREVLSVLENTPGACLWLSTLRERLYHGLLEVARVTH